MSYAAADRLHHSSEFLRLQRQGVRWQTPHFVLYAGRLPGDGRSRLGVTVSRKIGSAGVRNRVKRRVRECCRLALRERIPRDISLVVIALGGAGAIRGREVTSELTGALPTILKRLAK